MGNIFQGSPVSRVVKVDILYPLVLIEYLFWDEFELYLASISVGI